MSHISVTAKLPKSDYQEQVIMLLHALFANFEREIKLLRPPGISL